jgi:hypothetical protein
VQRLRRFGYEVERFYWGSGLVDDVPAPGLAAGGESAVAFGGQNRSVSRR